MGRCTGLTVMEILEDCELRMYCGFEILLDAKYIKTKLLLIFIVTFYKPHPQL